METEKRQYWRGLQTKPGEPQPIIRFLNPADAEDARLYNIEDPRALNRLFDTYFVSTTSPPQRHQPTACELAAAEEAAKYKWVWVTLEDGRNAKWKIRRKVYDQIVAWANSANA